MKNERTIVKEYLSDILIGIRIGIICKKGIRAVLYIGECGTIGMQFPEGYTCTIWEPDTGFMSKNWTVVKDNMSKDESLIWLNEGENNNG